MNSLFYQYGLSNLKINSQNGEGDAVYDLFLSLDEQYQENNVHEGLIFSLIFSFEPGFCSLNEINIIDDDLSQLLIHKPANDLLIISDKVNYCQKITELNGNFFDIYQREFLKITQILQAWSKINNEIYVKDLNDFFNLKHYGDNVEYENLFTSIQKLEKHLAKNKLKNSLEKQLPLHEKTKSLKI